MTNPNPQAQQQADDLADGFEIDLESDAPLAPACPLNPGEGECEACQ